MKGTKEAHISPDVTTYSAVTSACENGVQVQKALRAFTELRQWHKPDADARIRTASGEFTPGSAA